VTGLCDWDADAGLGACGDALGGAGVEGAWLSGRALAARLVARHRETARA
jgi:predicted NAD/FAD-dependent oxidoreductase